MATAEEKFDDWFSKSTTVEIFDRLDGEAQDGIIDDFVGYFDFHSAIAENLDGSRLKVSIFANVVLRGWDNFLHDADLSHIDNDNLDQPFTDDDDPDLAADEREGEDDGPADIGPVAT